MTPGVLPGDGIAITPDGRKAYVAYGDVTIIDTSTLAFIGTINTGGFASDVAITPDGTKAYVANSYDESVSVISTATNKVTATVETGFSGGISTPSWPRRITISPDGSKAYVTAELEYTNPVMFEVFVIDTATDKRTGLLVGDAEHISALALSPDGSRAYLAEYYSNQIEIVDTRTLETIDVIPSISSPTALALAPDGSRLYVAGEYDLYSVETDTLAVTAIAPDAYDVANRVAPFSTAIVVSPDGTRAFVSNRSYENSAYMIDTAKNAVTAKAFTKGEYPDGIAILPNGSKVFVANAGSNSVSVFTHMCGYAGVK